MTGLCPVCGVEMELSDTVEKGELLDCEDCGEEIEVKSIQPLELIPAPQEEEDWGE